MMWDLPASPGVERLWLLDQLGQRTAYNLPAAWWVDAAVTEDRVRAALASLAARHASLRTCLVPTATGLRCRISPEMTVPLVEVTVTDEPALPRLLREFARQPFDLGSAPLARALLARTGTGTLLALVVHHAVGDGVSMEVLGGDLSALLARRPLAPRSADADIEVLRRTAERQLAVTADHPGARWWRALLAGLPHCGVPLDRSRRARPTGRGRRVVEPLPPDTTAAIRRYASAHRCPPFVVGMAAAQLLVGRYTGNDRPVIGTVLANRPDPETASVVGFLSNTVALPANLAIEGLTFADLVRHTRETVFTAIEHQDVPFHRVVSALAVDLDLHRNPIFEVLFTAEQTGRPSAGSPLTPVEIDYEPAKFDVSLNLRLPASDPGRGQLSVLYAEDVLDQGTARTLAHSFGVLLRAALVTADAPVVDLPLAGDRERLSLLATPSPTELPGTVSAQVERQASATPDRPALIDQSESVSYRMLDRRANHLARAMRDRGLTVGGVVAVALPAGAPLVTTMLAVWKAGGVYLPVDPGLPAVRIRNMLADSGAVLQVIGAGEAPAVPELPVLPVGPLWGEWATPPPHRCEPPDLAYVIFTSGSTGRPKGVAIGHAALAAAVAAVRRTVPQTGPVAATSSPSFDISLFELVAPLTAGMPVVAAGRDPWPDRAAGVSWVQLTPSHARLLLRHGDARRGLRELDTLVVCGERLAADLAARLSELVTGRVVNAYGPTEATVWATIQDVDGPADEVVPIGRPLPGATAAVVDARGLPLPRGAIGELWLGGTGVAAGYLGRPGLTADRFRPDPYGPPGARRYRTGDLARVRSDGALEYLGRRDTQLKVRGHRIEAAEVEGALLALDEVAEAVVDVRSTESGVDNLVGYVVPAGGAGDLAGRLRARLAGVLPVSMIPSIVVAVPAIPLTASGKVDRAALARLELPGGDRPHRLTGSPLEREIAEIWTRLTGLDNPELDANYFDIGGDSLLLARFHALLVERFPAAGLRMIELFLATTLAATAAVIAERTGLADDEPVMDAAV